MAFQYSSVMITGGSKGIGLTIAKVFSRETERPIILLARNENELAKAKKFCLNEGAVEVHTISADITDSSALSEIDFSSLKIGILINNAGSFLFKNLKETTTEEFRVQFKINTEGAFNLTKQLLPELRKSNRALIVNICSVGALKGLKDSGAYSMSKHALLGYTRSLRKELMGTNIAVTAINLGQTYSTSWKEVDIDPNELIDPEDVGRLIVSLTKLSPRSVADEIILTPINGEVDPM
ncbi:SDR family NAD(P)-dependent oxidoreductase [Gracilimonas sp.]|uniref:SDR family NAD(P)-dependent oxidoreductase n=1 Tax=Gracilimonas sp. TaxID=1974203 RepID=UPI002870E8F4|nr:SDR family oxidoreductase [Gracilimonas sp.]